MKQCLRRLLFVLLAGVCGSVGPIREGWLLGNPLPPETCPLGEAPPVQVPVPTGDDPAPANVSLKIRTPACTAPGQPIEYHFFVENCSPTTAHNVLLRNPLPANARFLKASPEPARSDPELQWTIGTMRAGERREIVLWLAPLTTGDVQNCTRIQFDYGQCVTTRVAAASPGAGLDPGTGRPPVIFPIPPKLDPGKGKEKEPPLGTDVPGGKGKLRLSVAGPLKEFVNKVATYFLTVENIGTASASNLLVEVDLEGQDWLFVGASDNGQHLDNKIAWAFDGSLKAGQSRMVEVRLRAKRVGTHCFLPSVLADPQLEARTAKICTEFLPAKQAGLTLEMFDREDPIPLGGETSYPIVVRNQSEVAVTNLQIGAVVSDLLEITKTPIGPTTPQRKGNVIVFDKLASLEPGKQVEYEVFVRGIRAGDARFQVDLIADQFEAGPVREMESTIVYNEDLPPPRFVSQTRVRRSPLFIPILSTR